MRTLLPNPARGWVRTGLLPGHQPVIVEHMFEVTGEQPPVRRPRDPIPSSASRLWAERVNPVWWQTRTPVGDWQTDDRSTWRTTDGWLAQIQCSPNLRHVLMAIWHDGTYLGFQDDIGWHSATARRRTGHPHPVVRSLPMPLPLAG
jgi:hypothetical protein